MRLTDEPAADIDITLDAARFAGERSLNSRRQALDPAAFAACMTPLEPFESQPLLAIAVSGGADSLALTLLADDWAKRRGGRVVGLTVDHGLRQGSADEARRTGLWLASKTIEHHILPWRGDKPSRGLQRRARDARYALLMDWCREQRCLHLLTAHHRGDQAETVAIRKARQSGETGLAAMAAIREVPGLRLLRPLLGIDKAALQASLRAAGQPWLDDPSNDDPVFTRNRLRQTGLDVEALAEEAERQGVLRQTRDRRIATALVRHAILDPAGFATLDVAGLESLSPPLGQEVLQRLLVTIGGDVYPPRRDALSRLFAAMRAGIMDWQPKTLGHCRILEHRGRWLICRERARSAPLALIPGERQRWDDRFIVSLKAPHRGLTIAALGDQARTGEKTLLSRSLGKRLPGAVRPTLPAIRSGRTLVAIPLLGLFDATFRPEDLDLRFCPHTPLANAPFMPHINSL